MIKKLSKRWRDLTITLALPILIINSVMDYYYGWEARQQVTQYGDMIPSPTDSFTPEAKVDSYLSKIFQPIKNQVDRFSNWWRDLFKEEMIKDIRG